MTIFKTNIAYDRVIGANFSAGGAGHLERDGSEIGDGRRRFRPRPRE